MTMLPSGPLDRHRSDQ